MLRDSILDDGAHAGGASVSHPRWGDIRDDDPPFEEEPSYSVNSILHCSRGRTRRENPLMNLTVMMSILLPASVGMLMRPILFIK